MTSNYTFRAPTFDDAKPVLDLMIRCDIHESGEADSEMEDLVGDWKELDLNQDAWLIFSSAENLIGYASVNPWGPDLKYDIYAEPTLDDGNNELVRELLSRCEARGAQLANGEKEIENAKCYAVSVNQPLGNALADAGFEIKKYVYNMQAEFDSSPPPAQLPMGISIRNPIIEQDEQKIYEVIQSAFERPGRTTPSFEDWKGFMLRPEIFKPEFWFLAMRGDELVGACLSYEYSESDQGWVRQLGVLESHRRTGLGSALLQHAFHEFYKHGFKKVGLAVESDNQRAIRFYENVGMKQIRRFDEYAKPFEN
ncbi:MAG: GNAT family N-acetyltransferase [Anaerolineales bacterium]|nr:GNAT family N-acetyltransferase [Anaerolineales bacterium]